MTRTVMCCRSLPRFPWMPGSDSLSFFFAGLRFSFSVSFWFSIVRFTGTESDVGYAYLFDLEADPTETTNLLDDYPEVADGLEELLYAYLKEGVRSYYTASLDDDDAEKNFISVRLFHLSCLRSCRERVSIRVNERPISAWSLMKDV